MRTVGWRTVRVCGVVSQVAQQGSRRGVTCLGCSVHRDAKAVWSRIAAQNGLTLFMAVPTVRELSQWMVVSAHCGLRAMNTGLCATHSSIRRSDGRREAAVCGRRQSLETHGNPCVQV